MENSCKPLLQPNDYGVCSGDILINKRSQEIYVVLGENPATRVCVVVSKKNNTLFILEHEGKRFSAEGFHQFFLRQLPQELNNQVKKQQEFLDYLMQSNFCDTLLHNVTGSERLYTFSYLLATNSAYFNRVIKEFPSLLATSLRSTNSFEGLNVVPRKEDSGKRYELVLPTKDIIGLRHLLRFSLHIYDQKSGSLGDSLEDLPGLLAVAYKYQFFNEYNLLLHYVYEKVKLNNLLAFLNILELPHVASFIYAYIHRNWTALQSKHREILAKLSPAQCLCLINYSRELEAQEILQLKSVNKESSILAPFRDNKRKADSEVDSDEPRKIIAVDE